MEPDSKRGDEKRQERAHDRVHDYRDSGGESSGKQEPSEADYNDCAKYDAEHLS